MIGTNEELDREWDKEVQIMVSSASVGLPRQNHASRMLRVVRRSGLCLSLLSLSLTLTPRLTGDAKAIPPPHPVKPAKPAPTPALIAECFRQARVAEVSIPDWQHRVSALLTIGRAQLVSGDASGARATALDALRQIPTDARNPQDVGAAGPVTRSYTVICLYKGIVAEAVELLAKAGDPSDAMRQSDRLLDGEDRAETLLTIADVYANSYNLPEAKCTLNEALKSAFLIHDDSDRGETLSRLAASWKRIDPKGMPINLISDAIAALHDAEKSYDWQDLSIKWINPRWQASVGSNIPIRVLKSYARMGLSDELTRSKRTSESHGMQFRTSLEQEIRDEPSKPNNSLLSYPDVAFSRSLIDSSTVFAETIAVQKYSNLPDGVMRSNYESLLLASQEGDSWIITDRVTRVAERRWAVISDRERKLIQQVRSDLIKRSANATQDIDRAFLLCAAARLALLVGDREDARSLIGQASAFYDAPVTDTSSVGQIFAVWGKHREEDVRDSLLRRLISAQCILGDYSGAARFANEKGGVNRDSDLQGIAFYAANPHAARHALVISAEIEKMCGTMRADQTLDGVTYSLVCQHDWNDAHQAAMSVKSPAARAHALCLIVDGYYELQPTH